MGALGRTLILSLALLLPSAAAADGQLYSRALSIIGEQYLHIDELDVGSALVLAAEAAEDAIPWLIVDHVGGEIVLSHGERGEFARLQLTATDIGSLQPSLERLEAAIRAAPEVISDDIDLSVELLRGVSRALDRHSVVMYRDRLERFNERIKGRLDGIGSSISLREGEPHVSEVYPDSPAERGGLQAGDVIVQIDGFSTVGLSTEQLVGRIRGERGSLVVLSVRRGAALLELPLTRAEVRVPNVRWESLPSGVGLMAITNFSEQTTHFMRRALEEFRSAGPLEGIIIDLRGNTGGSMRQACYSVDQFLTSGTVLRTEGRDGAEVRGLMRRYPARIDGGEPEVPVVVLVDERSASASEILAGALMLSDRAVLLGERTHGKGTVQRREILRDDPADRVEMKLTVAEYKLTDARVPIELGVGLEPDLWVLPVTFTRGGAWLPDTVAVGQTNPELRFTDEQPGWREGVTLPEEDALVSLAEEILLAVAPGAWGRRDTLGAMSRVLPAIRADLDVQLGETFAFRGIDWSAAPEDAPPALDALSVRITVVDPPLAGEAVEVRAEVENLGAAPVHRLRLQLDADPRLPWAGVTLPIGHLAPGEVGLGSAMVTLPAGSPSRVDLVTPSVYADLSEPLVLEAVSLGIEGRPPLPMSTTASVRPTSAPGIHELVLQISNLGALPLEAASARLLLEDGTAIELLSREIDLGVIPAGGHQQAVVPLILPDNGLDEVVELRVEAAGWGPVLQVPIDLTEQPQLSIAPPAVRATAPTAAPSGPLDVLVTAEDDRRVEALTVWWDRDKIAWSDGGSPRDALLLSLDITPQHHTLTVKAIDDQGAAVIQTFHIQGVESDSAADAQGL